MLVVLWVVSFNASAGSGRKGAGFLSRAQFGDLGFQSALGDSTKLARRDSRSGQVESCLCNEERTRRKHIECTLGKFADRHFACNFKGHQAQFSLDARHRSTRSSETEGAGNQLNSLTAIKHSNQAVPS